MHISRMVLDIAQIHRNDQLLETSDDIESHRTFFIIRLDSFGRTAYRIHGRLGSDY